jgi:heat shock protein HtpX
MNYFKTALLLAALTAFFLAAGYLLGGQTGLVIALVAALGMNVFAYWNSDKMVLRMANAQEVGPNDAPEFYGLVQQLAQRGGLPMPRVYIINEDQPNAFATGRDPEHAAVAATTGLLDNLSREEIAGVMAHELSHVQHRDTLIMTVAATLSGAIGMLASFGGMMGGGRDENGRPLVNPIVGIAMMILAPLAAMLVQMAISRGREYEADRRGAELVGQPLWLASALAKLHAGTHRIPNEVAERNPATAHMYIANPLAAAGGGMASLFSTHPPMEERIARLEAMAAGPDRGRSAHAPLGPTMSPTGPWGAQPEAPRRGPWG